MAESRPRGLASCDLLTADELAGYVHRRRADAVAWAKARDIGLRCGDGPALYPVGEVLQALRDDRDRAKRKAPIPVPLAEVPLVLADVTPNRGGPRRGRSA